MNRAKLILILSIILIGEQVFGQINEDKKYLHLYSDSLIYGNNLEYITPIFKASHFLINSKRIEIDDVKFYYDGNYFYGNVDKINYHRGSEFAKRTMKGKINLYEDEIAVNNTHAGPIIGPGFGVGLFISFSNKNNYETRIVNYYNIGNEVLKRVSYYNLSNDLSGNPESVTYLDMYKKDKNKQLILQIAGISVATIAAIFTIKNPEYLEIGTIGIASGIISFGIGYTISREKTKLLWSAINVYNRSRY